MNSQMNFITDLSDFEIYIEAFCFLMSQLFSSLTCLLIKFLKHLLFQHQLSVLRELCLMSRIQLTKTYQPYQVYKINQIIRTTMMDLLFILSNSIQMGLSDDHTPLWTLDPGTLAPLSVGLQWHGLLKTGVMSLTIRF